MINQLSSQSDEDDYTSSAAYCWWTSATNFEESVKLKLELPNVSTLTPRLKVLREMERLNLVAIEGLNELRHKLQIYTCGDFWVPTGGIKKEDMDIPPINTILLVGFSGSGKSALVNLMYSVLGRCGLIPFAQTSGGSSKSATIFMEEHNVLRSLRSGFCVFDSRGLDYERVDQSLGEVSGWLTDGVHHNQPCLRPGDDVLCQVDDLEVPLLRSSSKFLTRRVDCVMVVANLAEIYRAFKGGDLNPLEATRELFYCAALKKCNENPILILTHGDMLSTEERIEGRLKICEVLRVSETTGVYDIVCLTEYGFLAEESDPITAYAVTEAVYRALLMADRRHNPKKLFHEWVMHFLSCFLCFMGAFFAFLAHICSKLGQMDKLK